MMRTIRRIAMLGVFAAILAATSLPSMAQNTYSLPLVLAAGGSQEGFVGVENNSSSSGTVRITAIDDTGRSFGPATLSLDGRETVYFRSIELERGNISKGLSGGVGDGRGHWRLFLETTLDITPLAYIRTSDGFVTAMHDVAPEITPGSRRYRVAFFNPGSNRNQVSRLRLINLGTTRANIEITGRDATGASRGPVRLSIPAGGASMLSAQALEAGTGLDGGRLGDGTGKWKLIVSSNVNIQVMSLLSTPTGHLTNLSTIPEYRGGSVPEPPTPTGDDHGNSRSTATAVRAPSTTAGNLETGGDIDYFRFDLPSSGQLRVYSTGNTDTYGTLYRGSSRIATNDDGGTRTNFGIVRGQAESGTYYIEVRGFSPSTTGAYRLHVELSGGTTPQTVWGALAGWIGANCASHGFGASRNYSSRSAAADRAIAECNSSSSGSSVAVGCEPADITFTRCGALAWGRNARGCVWGKASGDTLAAAEAAAITSCRRHQFGGNCSIFTGRNGNRSSICNNPTSGNAGDIARMMPSDDRQTLETNKILSISR